MGLEYEGDPRHAELVVRQLGLESAKGVSTPGVDWKEADVDETQEEELTGEDAKAYRMIAARMNYMSFDRPDAQYAIKEACREMARPTRKAYERLVRIGKYLKANPRLVWKFELQVHMTVIEAWTDANWAACRRTRKSTSGGALRRGGHCLKTWSKTQAVVAKSSAESELYGVVKGGCELLGLLSLAGDFGDATASGVIMLDAAAAMGIIERKGVGKGQAHWCRCALASRS